jgi:uncharacterized protein YhhL (DUF1145 family)
MVNSRKARKLRITKLNIIDCIIILLGIAAPFGERLNILVNNISRAYVILGALLILVYILNFMLRKPFTRIENIKIYKHYVAFIVFIFAHSTVTYYMNDFVNIFEHYKIFVFAIISLMLLKSFNAKYSRANYFITAFGLSYLTIVIFFNNYIEANTVLRAEGAYSNANAFALDAVFVLFTSLYLLTKKNMYRFKPIIMLLGGFIGIFLSGTRSAFLGLLSGTMIYFTYSRGVQKKLKIIGLFALAGLTILIIMPSESWYAMMNRFFRGDSELSGYSSNIRLVIWGEYLDAWRKYFIFGLDMDSWSVISTRVTHNTYLNVLVRFGFLGFLLYFKNIATNLKLALISCKLSSHTPIVAMFIAFLFLSIFIDAFTLKTFWIVWAFAIHFNYRHKKHSRSASKHSIRGD